MQDRIIIRDAAGRVQFDSATATADERAAKLAFAMKWAYRLEGWTLTTGAGSVPS